MYSNQGAGLGSTFTSMIGGVIAWTWNLHFKMAPSLGKAMTLSEHSSSRGATSARRASATGRNPMSASMTFFIGDTVRAKVFGELGRLTRHVVDFGFGPAVRAMTSMKPNS